MDTIVSIITVNILCLCDVFAATLEKKFSKYGEIKKCRLIRDIGMLLWIMSKNIVNHLPYIHRGDMNILIDGWMDGLSDSLIDYWSGWLIESVINVLNEWVLIDWLIDWMVVEWVLVDWFPHTRLTHWIVTVFVVTGFSKGYAFIEYEHERDAKIAYRVSKEENILLQTSFINLTKILCGEWQHKAIASYYVNI